MTRTLKITIAISDENKIVSYEDAKGFSPNQVESHLLIIGLLENLKKHHLEKLNTMFEKTINKKDGEYI